MTIFYLFSKFNDQDIDWMVGAGTRRNVSEGEVIIHAGESLKSFFIILSGQFRVTVGEQLIVSINPGESLGELSFLDSGPSSGTVAALEDSVVVTFSLKRLRTKLRLDDGFASRFYPAVCILLADRLRRSYRMLSTSLPALSNNDIHPTLSPLTEDQSLLRLFGQVGKRLDVAAGMTLLSQGQPGDRFYLTVSGWFWVTVEQTLVEYVGPNEVLGELGFLDGLPPASTSTAAEDCAVLVYDVNELRLTLRGDRKLASQFYRSLGVLVAARARKASQLLSMGGFYDRVMNLTNPIPPLLLDETTLASTRFDDMRRNFLET